MKYWAREEGGGGGGSEKGKVNEVRLHYLNQGRRTLPKGALAINRDFIFGVGVGEEGGEMLDNYHDG